MAQPQRQADVHQDELCPPNKRYALMDANKKIDLDNPLCPNESKIMANILQNHPLRFSIVASSSVPWIYLRQFWHNLKEDGSKLHIPPRRSTRLTPPTPIPTAVEAEDIILQDTIQLSIAEQKSHDDLEAKQNEVGEDKVDNSILNSQNDPDTRVEPRNEEESAENDYKLIIREKGKEELTITDSKPSSSTPSSSPPKPTLSMSQHILSLFKLKTGRFKRYKSFFDELQGRYGYLFGHLKTRFTARKKFNVLAQHLQDVMEEALPKIVDDRVKELTMTHMQFSKNARIFRHILLRKLTMLSLTIFHLRYFEIRPRDQDDPHDDAHPEGDNNSYATNDDDLPTDKVSQELVEEISQTVDEAKLRKVVDKMLRQRCTLGDEHQYHIDQMQNFLKKDILDPKAHALSRVNQDLMYLKKGNSGPEKIMLSLHKFHAIIFIDDDIEERTSK
ncbi:hypothetical protein Tco_0058698 [Tanacetum coccineum]